MSLTQAQLTALQTEITTDPTTIGYATYYNATTPTQSNFAGLESLINNATIIQGHYASSSDLANAIENAGMIPTLENLAATSTSPLFSYAVTFLWALEHDMPPTYRWENSQITQGLAAMVTNNIITTAQATQLKAVFQPVMISRAMQLFNQPVDWETIQEAIS